MPPQPVTPPDPIDSAEPADLRTEILRLRDANIGLRSQAEVLEDRLADSESRNTELRNVIDDLDARNQALLVELGRSPIIRAARAVARRLRLR